MYPRYIIAKINSDSDVVITSWEKNGSHVGDIDGYVNEVRGEEQVDCISM